MAWTSSVSPSSAFTSTCVLHWPYSAVGRVRWCHCFFFFLTHNDWSHAWFSVKQSMSTPFWTCGSNVCVHRFLMRLWFLDSCLWCVIRILLGLDGIFKCTVCASHPSALFWSARFWRHRGWMLYVSPSFSSDELDGICDAKKIHLENCKAVSFSDQEQWDYLQILLWALVRWCYFIVAALCRD